MNCQDAMQKKPLFFAKNPFPDPYWQIYRFLGFIQILVLVYKGLDIRYAGYELARCIWYAITRQNNGQNARK